MTRENKKFAVYLQFEDTNSIHVGSIESRTITIRSITTASPEPPTWNHHATCVLLQGMLLRQRIKSAGLSRSPDQHPRNRMKYSLYILQRLIFSQLHINTYFTSVCVCMCVLPSHLFWTSGFWTYQPGSHRRKVTQDFSTFLLRCLR